MLFDIFYFNLIWFNLTNLLSFNFFLVFFLFLAPGIGLLFFLKCLFFLFGWNRGGNWWHLVLGVWNRETFLSPHRRHCFIQGLWLITSCFSWMWACCLRRVGVLVDMLSLCESHTPCTKHFPSKKKIVYVINFTYIKWWIQPFLIWLIPV